MNFNTRKIIVLIMTAVLVLLSVSLPGFAESSSKGKQPLPEHGKTERYTDGDPIAPLQIKTPPGYYYLIKMVDSQTEETALAVFIHGGLNVNIKVPLGTYELRYASGEKWYGYEDLFGPATAYSKVEDLFEFKVENNYVYGFTLTLYSVENGNLVTSPLNPADF